jgi:hypothetical protein
MMPYGYHNSEINHMNREEQRNAREAIRQAKLVRQQAIDEAASTEPECHTARPKLLHRMLASAPRLAPRAYLRHLRTHSH